MSIEIDILSGDASWPAVQPLFDAVWPATMIRQLPWRDLDFARADLRVLVESDDRLICHVGITRRDVTWNGRALRAGGIGGVATHPDFRGRGLAGVALTAAIQTLKEERATDFALLFCESHTLAFYTARGWKPFTGEIYADQKGQRMRFDALLPLVFYIRRAPHDGEIDLCGLPW